MFFSDKLKYSDEEIIAYLLDLALANRYTSLERSEAMAILNDGVDYSLEDDKAKTSKLRRMLGLVLNYPSYQYK